MGQDVVGQNFVGQDVTGAISLGQNVVGQEVSGAGRRGAELRGAGRRWGKISGAGGHGAEGSGAGSGSPTDSPTALLFHISQDPIQSLAYCNILMFWLLLLLISHCNTCSYSGYQDLTTV